MASPLGLILAVLLILAPRAGHAFESRFSVSPGIDLAELSRTHGIAIHTWREGSLYYSDASSVLEVPLDRLAAVSLDYDHYVQMRMPNLRQSVTVVRDGAQHLYIWNQMSAMGQVSNHYLEVLYHPDLPNGDQGSEWQLFHPDNAPQWKYEDSPAFKRLDGSWYMKPLADGKIYVRYFLVGDPDVPLPDRVISAFLKHQFTDGVRQVIQVLAREAALRQ